VRPVSSAEYNSPGYLRSKAVPQQRVVREAEYEEVIPLQGHTVGPEEHPPVWMVERAIVLWVLGDDHEGLAPRVELSQEILDCQPTVIDEALERLEGDGVLLREGDLMRAARAARRLDELELIGI
jgi:hypothetical protein